ncbi:Precorrin-8X methylmutase CbiC/CobH [Methanolacinia petrolearia DSM 11571]|uniref:Precorrin-8X methylmutase CbiC/CobH n=1 Tax=Methanolacinia petrolearia (strain DSM 11571 / OCM 486 / SEBR 4847) TaxID=679926 RepID=E1RHX4_METP4|nr:precorrin-8X methylmutase [Methanolacinia petrolearia]ADN36512.1 Precorrin-8X methylmutase CbiC/CobH [Methanolacinia petrolearia DSM 11571]
MTGNTYIDPGADTKEGYQISSTSRGLARMVVGDETPEDRIRQRCAISVGDFIMADLMAFKNNPIDAGLKALESGAPIITDIRMVQTGIRKKEHNSEVLCVLDYEAEVSKNKEITRSSAGFIALKDKIGGSIIVIGNAPSALLMVCDFIDKGIKPALVIGTPVGFVNAKESKEILRTKDVPSISNRGTRGGTPPAVASMNEIITMFIEKQQI